MAIATINPATGETLKTFDELSEAEEQRSPGYRGRRARRTA